ncbi:hypothetical protein WICPIJ_004831 [Wickerhamomyces pijperi]|uniref:Purine permease n=1 Tax=Wickerhamomyces pijperi TaxID=599730 RepID=A0A9P8Q4Z6_WICPI|nr:hypothetical protein WICPIJ_004831 [Wickerhamomyces pijperi]
MTDIKLRLRSIKNKFTTKHGLLGDYNYKYLFTPEIPFITKKDSTTKHLQPFFGLNSDMPVVLGFVLGLQHALSMLAGVVTPPIIISSAAQLSAQESSYLVSAALITSGLLSLIQITRFKIPYTNYYIGSGLLSVLGTSFATISIVNNAFPLMYQDGTCKYDADGNKMACPEGYGALLGTACVTSLLEIALSFMPASTLQKLFPPIVTGPVVLLIGISLIQSGFEDWLGGSGCMSIAACPSVGGPMAAPWGSARFIGLGFLVFVTIVFCEKWGSPIMKSTAVIVGLLVGCIVAAAAGYFEHSSIDSAPVGTFLWVHTFKLSIYGPAVLPFLATYIVLMMEAIGDMSATSDVSRLPIYGPEFDSRIQGGILNDGIAGCLSCLMTITPMSTFAQNNGVISMTKCANRMAGYWCCAILIIMGIFGKFSGAILSIPKPVLGGMTTFLFTSVCAASLSIISRCKFTRRDRFVLTCSLVFGLGATMVSDWFSFVFTYDGDNKALKGFYSAIVLVCETGYAIGGIVGVIMNLIIPEEDITDEHLDVLEGTSTGPEEDSTNVEAYGLDDVSKKF